MFHCTLLKRPRGNLPGALFLRKKCRKTQKKLALRVKVGYKGRVPVNQPIHTTMTTTDRVAKVEATAKGNLSFMRTIATAFKDADKKLCEAINARVAEIEKMAAKLEMTAESAMLFSHIVEKTSFDFCEDDTDEYICGFMSERDMELDKAMRGNLSDIKKKGLLRLDYCGDPDPSRAGFWVELTVKGQNAAETLGIDCCA